MQCEAPALQALQNTPGCARALHGQCSTRPHDRRGPQGAGRRRGHAAVPRGNRDEKQDTRSPRGFSGVSRAATRDTCPSANGGCIGVTVVTSQPGRQRVRRTNGTSQGVGLRAANPSSGHQGAEGRASSGVSPRHCGKRGTGGNPGWRGAGVWAGHSESWGTSWAGSRPGRLHPPRTPPPHTPGLGRRRESGPRARETVLPPPRSPQGGRPRGAGLSLGPPTPPPPPGGLALLQERQEGRRPPHQEAGTEGWQGRLPSPPAAAPSPTGPLRAPASTAAQRAGPVASPQRGWWPDQSLGALPPALPHGSTPGPRTTVASGAFCGCDDDRPVCGWGGGGGARKLAGPVGGPVASDLARLYRRCQHRPRLHLQGSAGCSRTPAARILPQDPRSSEMPRPGGPRPLPVRLWPWVPGKESSDVCAGLGPGCQVVPERCPFGPPPPALSCVPARGRLPQSRENTAAD